MSFYIARYSLFESCYTWTWQFFQLLLLLTNTVDIRLGEVAIYRKCKVTTALSFCCHLSADTFRERLQGSTVKIIVLFPAERIPARFQLSPDFQKKEKKRIFTQADFSKSLWAYFNFLRFTIKFIISLCKLKGQCYKATKVLTIHQEYFFSWKTSQIQKLSAITNR